MRARRDVGESESAARASLRRGRRDQSLRTHAARQRDCWETIRAMTSTPPSWQSLDRCELILFRLPPESSDRLPVDPLRSPTCPRPSISCARPASPRLRASLVSSKSTARVSHRCLTHTRLWILMPTSSRASSSSCARARVCQRSASSPSTRSSRPRSRRGTNRPRRCSRGWRRRSGSASSPGCSPRSRAMRRRSIACGRSCRSVDRLEMTGLT